MGSFQVMITRIKLQGAASYKSATCLESDKKINLIYGLNGSGKSTLSNYLYGQNDQEFSCCSLDGLGDDCRVLVYNQKFVQDNFYQSDTLNGIFTLSKENKEIEEKIDKLQSNLSKKYSENEELEKEKKKQEQHKKQTERNVENKLWEIKTTYSGGDRVLEFCLKGKMGGKSALKNHIITIQKPDEKPPTTVDDLKQQAEAVKGDNASSYEKLQPIVFNADSIESNQLFQEEIIGNTNSRVAGLIEKIKHYDWVRQGLDYLPDRVDETGSKCPFCQELTITESLISEIKNYFDETYEKSLNELKIIFENYTNLKNELSPSDNYKTHPAIIDDKDEFEKLYGEFLTTINNNIRKIEDKIKSPSIVVNLDGTENHISNLNSYIENKNHQVAKHNRNLDEKDKTISDITEKFWLLMRWEYDQTIERYLLDEENLNNQVENLNDKIKIIDNELKSLNTNIGETQKQTVNIEQAIESINNGLSDLGISGFSIQRHEDNGYKLTRNEPNSDTFHTLSEGEKMIISFLYFIELCRGKHNPTDTRSKKIAVIDDPVSSLSHVFVFNIGQLIKREFFNGNYEQIFVLTHSLYFFYELTDTNHNRRKDTQNLFRIHKNNNGSHIEAMKYEEIQNDYQSYWQIVNDDQQHPALIANCMRNIIEYFFNFVEKTDLNNVFQKESLRNDKYQAFCRYMNRESHSLGQNIFDMKEFDYTNFKEALKLVFQETEYDNHYKKMVAIYNT